MAHTINENLSYVYEQIGNLEKAIDYQMNAIEISEKYYGRIHPRTQKSYQRAGEKLDANDDWDLALKYLYEASEIQMEISGDPTFELADLCHRIGSLHYGLDDFENAERMLKNSINMLSDIDGYDDWQAEWIQNLGQVYETTKNFKNALEQYELSLKLKLELSFDEESIHETEEKIASLKALMNQ